MISDDLKFLDEHGNFDKEAFEAAWVADWEAQQAAAAPPIPQTFDADLIPEIEETGISDAAMTVDGAFKGIDIFEVYERLSKGKYKDARRTGESILISCPDPAHPDNNPSAWINADKQTWYCGACQQGGDKVDIAKFAYGNQPFWEIKKRLVNDLRGVNYDAITSPPPAPVPSTQPIEAGEPDPFEEAVEKEKAKQRIYFEARDRLRRERSEGLFTPPPFNDDLESELAVDDPDVEWTIDHLHTVGTNTTITAGFKVGKTTFMLNLVRSLADNSPFLGHHEVRALDGRIALWNFEIDQVQMKRNIREMGIKKLANVWHLPLRGHHMNLMDDIAYEWAVKETRRQEIEVLIIDPFSGAYYGDENSNSEVNLFTKRLDEFKREAGVSDLFIPVHTGRTVEEGNERARGAAKLDDWTDNRWVLAKHIDTGYRFFKADGRRIGQEERELIYHKEDHSYTYSAFKGTRKEKAGDTVKQQVLAFVTSHPGCTFNEIREGVTGNHTTIRKETKALIANFDVETRPGKNNSTHHYVQGTAPLVVI